MKTFPLSETFHLLEPGPVVLLTTSHRGRANVMTMSWHMMMEFEPPLIGCIVSNANFSFRALRATRECVIAIPTVDMASKVVEIGNCSGEEVNKFEVFNLTALSAEQVQAPLIAECLANIECKVIDTSLVNKYNLFILEGVKTWSDPKRKERRTIHANGDGTFVTDGKTLDLKKKMVKWKGLI